MSDQSTKSDTATPKRPPRGPSIWTLIVVVAVLALGLWIGAKWGDRIASGAERLWQTVVGSGAGGEETTGTGQFYTCGMHPWVILPKPGDCPICHMKLEPIDPKKFTGKVTIDPVVVQNIGVRIEPVTTGPLVRTIRTVGTVDYDETRVRDVNVKTPGWIEKLHVDYLGAPVKKGDPLFEFYSPELYAAQEEYLLALKNSGQIGAEFVPDAAGGAKDLLEAARTRLLYFDIRPEQVERIRLMGQPSKTLPILSQYEGVVIEKHANEGMKVDQGMRIFRIADLSKVWVMVTVYEYQLPYVQEGQTALMTLAYLPGKVFEGKVVYVYPYLNEKVREVKVRLEFDNPQSMLKPGMFANVQLRNTLAEERVLAPRSAILDTGRRQVAFVSLGEGRFEPRQVEVGVETEEGVVEIRDGLKPGEMVVTSGQFLIDSEARIREALAKMIKGETAGEQKAAVAVAGQSELDSLGDEAANRLGRILDDYFAIGRRLRHDQMEGLVEPAQRIADDAAGLLEVAIPGRPHFWHQHEELAVVGGKALQLKVAADLAEARLRYADLSWNLAKLVKATGVPPGYAREVHQMRCPMFLQDQGGAMWLQPAGEISNPYMGQRMPDCIDRDFGRRALPVTGLKGPAAEGPATQPGERPSPEAPATPAELSAQARGQLDRLVHAYLQLHRLLAQKQTEPAEAAGPLKQLHAAANALADQTQGRAATLAKALAAGSHHAPAGVEGLRESFAGLSRDLMELVKLAPPSGQAGGEIYHAYCPMVQKSWLQAGEGVANPYDPTMLECGVIKGKISAGRADSKE